jgi:outer membrane biosynthesis protein TonB
MKKSTVIFALLMLSLASFAQDSGLWLISARISHSSTMNKDTLIRTEAGNHLWEVERHAVSRTMTRGDITAVIENQAEDPTSEFMYHSDAGEPVSLTVSGEGSHSESSKYVETIDGKMISADQREINVSGSALPEASLMFYYSPDSKDAYASIGIRAKGSDRGRRFFEEWKDYGGDLDDYSLSCSAGCAASGDRSCNITKTSTGYQATWKFSEIKQIHTVYGTEFITTESTLSLTIASYKEPDKPEVNLYGCSELGMEEQGEIMASGKPEGGKFRFWVEPGSLLEVQSDESSAIVTGSTPGKGTLYVEYTTPAGKTNTTSQPASCVKIENYNGGQAVPQIPLYDLAGKKLPGVLKVSLSAQPSNVEELVDFVPADKSVLSAVGLSGAVELTGLKEGKTTLKATTNCGHQTGPTVEVEVVNCDDETIVRLEKQRQTATENLQNATKELQKLAGSKEFEKARDDLVASTIDLLAKTGLTIISGGKPTSKVVKTAAEIADVAAGLSDMLASGSHEELYINGVKAAAGKIWGEAASTLVGLGEVAAAADRFYENIGEIQLHEEAMKSALESYEKAIKALEDVVKRQQICKRDKTQPQKTEEPKADPTPEPTKPTPPKEPKPRTDTPPAKEKPTEEPTTPEPGDEEPPISPPPPTSEPRQVGLPYSPEECGCDKTKSISVNSADFSTLQSGIKNIGDCVENFNKTSVNDYAKTLSELSGLTDSLKVAADGDPEIFRVKATKAKPQLDSLIKQTKSYDEAGKTFLKQFEKCPESVTTGMEVLKSALTVTVDSVTTKY